MCVKSLWRPKEGHDASVVASEGVGLYEYVPPHAYTDADKGDKTDRWATPHSEPHIEGVRVRENGTLTRSTPTPTRSATHSRLRKGKQWKRRPNHKQATEVPQTREQDETPQRTCIAADQLEERYIKGRGGEVKGTKANTGATGV